MVTMTFGVMPTREQFDAGFDQAVVEASSGTMASGLFSFGSDKRVGNCALNQEELWAEITKAHAEYDAGDEASGDWCSAVLGCLGFEWV